jgi:hypothetical protein
MKSVAQTLAPQSPGLTHQDLQILRAPFPKQSLGVKVQSTNKDRSRAMLVLYLGHTDVQDRLEQVDPSWTSEVLAEDHRGDTVYVRIRMTVKGVSRENVGEGGDPKAAYSDALKRAAMLFGIGRYLYDSVTVWTEYNESRDRYRTWTIEDYESALSRIRGAGKVPDAAPPAPPAPEAEPPKAEAAKPADKPGLKTRSKSASQARSREQLNRILMNLYRPYLSKFPETQFVNLLQDKYGVGETRLMTVEQIEDLVRFMEEKLQSVA